MFSSALIVFRESLEAALLIGIFAAAARGMAQRNRWIAMGVAGGLLGALLVAALSEPLANLASGAGQDLFNAVVLGVAVLMLAWHNIWMASHGAHMARDAKRVVADVRSGKRTLSAIALAIALAVLREGAETVLFIYSIATSSETKLFDLVGGSVLGFVGGVAAGCAIYAGLLRIPVHRLFSVTGALILLLAAGMAGQMARFLIQADWLPPLASPLWDSTWLLSGTSALGSALHILIGYEAKPTGTQALFYVATFLTIALASYWVKQQRFTHTHRKPA
jgi:high-affinity iron transporter